MAEQLHSHVLDNGLTLLVHQMDWMQSAAFSVWLPAGCIRDPQDKLGLANFTCEMVQRGCGDRTSRQFVEALERLGIERSASASTSHTSYGGAMPADRLEEAWPIYADLVRRPALPSEQLEEGRLVCLQELHAMEDDLSQRLLTELRKQTYASPWGRSSQGSIETVGAISQTDVEAFHAATYQPVDTMVSVAGNVQFDQVREQVERYFGSWNGKPLELQETPATGPRYLHIPYESQQTHLGIACPSLPYSHEDYFLALTSASIVGSGMSSRLFTEVREKRGLCYSVFASSHTLREQARLLCYCGTMAPRAQESLEVILAELARMQQGVTEDELRRVKVKLKSKLVMQQESSASRSAAIATDWYHLGRLVPVEELSTRIEAIDLEAVNRYLTEQPMTPLVIVTLGPQPLEMPDGVSPSPA